MEIRQRVSDISVEDGWALVKISQVPDQPGVAATIFAAIAKAEVNVDLILQNSSQDHITDLSFTIRQNELKTALDRLADMGTVFGSANIEGVEHLAKVELMSTGILNDSLHVSELFRSLAAANINILAIGTSEVRISCLIIEADHEKALRALKKTFKKNSG